MPREKRVLFVSYLFPPVGGAGVQRVAKFVKYLPGRGWMPSVLTVANPSVPVFDDSLLRDVPGGVIVRTARTREPSYAVKAAVSAGAGRPSGGSGVLRQARRAARRAAGVLLQPDAQILWASAAIREGRRLLAELPHDAILVSGPPFSTFLVAASLAERSGLPLVLDYRDEWGLSQAHFENRRPGLVSRLIQWRMQRRVVRSAAALLATTRSSARALEEVRNRAGGAARVSWIYNGYDPDDFPGGRTPVKPAGETYRLAYVGTLWNLTSAAPLAEAVAELSRRRPDLAARLEIVFAGRRMPLQQAFVDRMKGLPCRVLEYPYVEHGEAIELLLSADGLCVLLSDVPGAGRVVPAKIFECMAARRSILAIAPRGELWDILAEHPSAYALSPGDVGGIVGALEREIGRPRGATAAGLQDWDGSAYDRRNQAAQLARVLDESTDEAAGARGARPWAAPPGGRHRAGR